LYVGTYKSQACHVSLSYQIYYRGTLGYDSYDDTQLPKHKARKGKVFDKPIFYVSSPESSMSYITGQGRIP